MSRTKRTKEAVEHAESVSAGGKRKQELNWNDRRAVMRENEELRELALNSDRRLVLQRMKLKLYHGRRAVEALRCFWNFPGPDEEEMIQILKVKNDNVLYRIGLEKARIQELRTNQSEEKKAAISIQSLVRGFLVRRRIRIKR
jgi:hypothetical protein